MALCWLHWKECIENQARMTVERVGGGGVEANSVWMGMYISMYYMYYSVVVCGSYSKGIV